MTHSTQRRRHGTKTEPLATESRHDNAKSKCAKNVDTRSETLSKMRKSRSDEYRITCHNERSLTTDSKKEPSPHLHWTRTENIFSRHAQCRQTALMKLRSLLPGRLRSFRSYSWGQWPCNVHSLVCYQKERRVCACSAHTCVYTNAHHCHQQQQSFTTKRVNVTGD